MIELNTFRVTCFTSSFLFSTVIEGNAYIKYEGI
jgi:hypothetical protein